MALSATRFDYSYLVGINIITCGIELCTSAAFCYLPPMLLEAGFSESFMSVVMGLGPLCALFLLPVMGTLSDQCTSPYGRRKPFIIGLTVAIFLSLILLPYSTNLASFLGGVLPERTVSIVMLAFSVVLLDFCTQVAYTPIASLLSDPCENEEQHNRSFSVFTFMLSLGACLGYWVSAIDWTNTRLGVIFGGQEHALFAILLVTFLFTATVSLLIINDPQVSKRAELQEVLTTPSNGTVRLELEPELNSHKRLINGNVPNNNSINSTGEGVTPVPNKPDLELVQVKPVSFIRRLLHTIFFCPCLVLASVLPNYICTPVLDTIQAMKTMPDALRRLWICNLLSCTAVMGFRLYFTDYIGSAIYHGNPDSEPGSQLRIQYEQGIRMGTWGLFLHSVTSVLYSLVLERFISSFGTRVTYLFGMAVFTIMTGTMLFVSHISTSILLAAFTGFASATITTVPYTLLTMYHEKTEVYYHDMDPIHAPLHGKGADIALLDSAYVMSEVVSSFGFGILVGLTANTVSYIVCSFVCGLLSCFLIFKLRCG